MSLGIAFKGPEGIVLAADSRVTLYHPLPEQSLYITATYDNAIKLLHTKLQKHIGVVTYGLGSLGQIDFRTPHSLLPEFNDRLLEKARNERLTVERFSSILSEFLLGQWESRMPKDYVGQDMCFLVAGYDKGEAYGKVFWFSVPNNPNPTEFQKDSFGIAYDGQREFADRLMHGFDDSLVLLVKDFLKLADKQTEELQSHLLTNLNIQIPIQFLPLQDCLDLSIFLIRATIMMQTWLPIVRGVGGAIDVATITRTEGFKIVQQKHITGEQPSSKFETSNEYMGGKSE